MQRGHYGYVHNAAAPWQLWSGSPRLRRASALPQSALAKDHDLLFLISKRPSVEAPAEEDCPLPL